MKTVFYIFIAVFFVAHLSAQKKYSKAQFRKDSIAIMKPKIARIQLRLDNKITFYKGESYNIQGFDAGVILKEKIRLTLGYYTLNDELSGYARTSDGIYFDRHLKLQYGSLNMEFIYHNSRFFTLGVPLEFGFGENKLRYKTSPDALNRYTNKGFISLIDFGLSGTVKPIRWIGLRAVAGYRKTLFNKVPGSRFDGGFMSVGIAVNLREISKDVRMFLLKKKYKRLGNPVETAIDLITD